MRTICTDYTKLHTNGTAVAIGNFDGVHIGHTALLDTLCALSEKNGLMSVVYTFKKHPVMRQKLLTLNAEKEKLIKNTGADILFFDNFESVRNLSPEEFVKDILVDKFNIKLAVVGENNRFGKNGAGNAEMLKRLGEQYGFLVYVQKTVSVDNLACSSSNIRKYIENGDIKTAKKLLGRAVAATGKVVGGKQLGRTYGFPTVNIELNRELIYPERAVYATNVYFDNKKYKGITNIGTTSFDDADVKRIETHILDFNGDLYDKIITVEFLEKMRDFKPFKDTDELFAQLTKDKQNRLKITEE